MVLATATSTTTTSTTSTTNLDKKLIQKLTQTLYTVPHVHQDFLDHRDNGDGANSSMPPGWDISMVPCLPSDHAIFISQDEDTLDEDVDAQQNEKDNEHVEDDECQTWESPSLSRWTSCVSSVMESVEDEQQEEALPSCNLIATWENEMYVFVGEKGLRLAKLDSSLTRHVRARQSDNLERFKAKMSHNEYPPLKADHPFAEGPFVSIRLDGFYFEWTHVRQIVINKQGTILVVATPYACISLQLPSKAEREIMLAAVQTSADCITMLLKPFQILELSREVIQGATGSSDFFDKYVPDELVKVAFHPNSLGDGHLVTLSKQGVMRIYNLQENRDTPETELFTADQLIKVAAVASGTTKAPMSHVIVKSALNMTDNYPSLVSAAVRGQEGAFPTAVSFCFGSESSLMGWEALTVWILLSDGRIFAASPILPSRCIFSRDYIASLQSVIAVRQEKSDDDDISSLTAIASMQQRFLDALDLQPHPNDPDFVIGNTANRKFAMFQTMNGMVSPVIPRLQPLQFRFTRPRSAHDIKTTVTDNESDASLASDIAMTSDVVPALIVAYCSGRLLVAYLADEKNVIYHPGSNAVGSSLLQAGVDTLAQRHVITSQRPQAVWDAISLPLSGRSALFPQILPPLPRAHRYIDWSVISAPTSEKAVARDDLPVQFLADPLRPEQCLYVSRSSGLHHLRLNALRAKLEESETPTGGLVTPLIRQTQVIVGLSEGARTVGVGVVFSPLVDTQLAVVLDSDRSGFLKDIGFSEFPKTVFESLAQDDADDILTRCQKERQLPPAFRSGPFALCPLSQQIQGIKVERDRMLAELDEDAQLADVDATTPEGRAALKAYAEEQQSRLKMQYGYFLEATTDAVDARLPVHEAERGFQERLNARMSVMEGEIDAILSGTGGGYDHQPWNFLARDAHRRRLANARVAWVERALPGFDIAWLDSYVASLPVTEGTTAFAQECEWPLLDRIQLHRERQDILEDRLLRLLKKAEKMQQLQVVQTPEYQQQHVTTPAVTESAEAAGEMETDEDGDELAMSLSDLLNKSIALNRTLARSCARHSLMMAEDEGIAPLAPTTHVHGAGDPSLSTLEAKTHQVLRRLDGLRNAV